MARFIEEILSQDDRISRVDSDYYASQYRNLIEYAFDAWPEWVAIDDAKEKLTSGHTPLRHNVDEGDCQFITVECVSPLQIHWDKTKRVWRESIEGELKRVRLLPGDVLITIKRRIVDSCPVPEVDELIAVNQDVAVYRPDSRFVPSFVSAFLASRIGKYQAFRAQTEQMNPYISVSSLGKILLPLVPLDTQYVIEGMVNDHTNKLRSSERMYAQAQEMLLEEMGIKHLDLSPVLTYEATLDHVVSTLRYDAEYFQPKFYRLLERIQELGSMRLGDLVRDPIRRGYQPTYSDDGDLTVINSQHVGKSFVDLRDNRSTSTAIVTNKGHEGAIVGQYDVLLNATGYQTIGRSQVLFEDRHAFVDGHVTIIRPKDGLDPVYLALFLNSLPGYMQTERGWTGSSGQIELRPQTVSEFSIWNAPKRIQAEIRAMVEQAYTIREEARILLTRILMKTEEIVLSGGSALED